jgi:Tol biopolymer transport system component
MLREDIPMTRAMVPAGARSLAPLLLLLLATALAGPAAAQQVTLVTRADPSLVSDTPAGTSWPVALSADGRYVAFLSEGANLVAGQNGPAIANLFLYDSATGNKALVTHANGSPTTGADSLYVRSVAMSADGRYLAFSAQVTNLVPSGGPIYESQIYLYDRQTGANTLISHTSSSPGTPANATSDGPVAISADGSSIAFVSLASDLVAAATDANGVTDVFLYDRVAGTTVLASHAAASTKSAGNGSSDTPALSADGNALVFTSQATDLVAGLSKTGHQTDVFLFSKLTGTVVPISHTAAAANVTANGDSTQPVVSADGATVAFVSAATDLVAGQSDANGATDVFLWSRASGANRLVSHTAAGTGADTRAADGASSSPAISADGSWVAFSSLADDLAVGESPATGGSRYGNVYLWSRTSGQAALVSHTLSSPTVMGNWESDSPVISADGAWVVYTSFAYDLVGDSYFGSTYRYSRATAANSLVSHEVDDANAGAGFLCNIGGVSADGRFVAFGSSATADRLVAGVVDSNGYDSDVFLYDGASNANTLVSRRDPASPSLSACGRALMEHDSLSADGRFLVWASDAWNLTTPWRAGFGPLDSGTQVYAYDRLAGSISLVSHLAGYAGQTCDRPASSPIISGDGRWIAFATTANNAVAGEQDYMPSSRAILFDRLAGTATLASHASGLPLTAADGDSQPVLLSHDGRYLLFSSTADNLVAGQVNANPFHLFFYNLFLFDRTTATSTLVNHGSSSPVVSGNGGFQYAAMSGDARFVAFVSFSTDLVPGQTGTAANWPAIFLYDRATGAISLLNPLAAQQAPPVILLGITPDLAVSADGSTVVFASPAAYGVPGLADANGADDVFAYATATGVTTLVSHIPSSALTTGNAASHSPSISADGRWITFASAATDLVEGGSAAPPSAPGAENVFLFDGATGRISLVSHAAASPTTAAAGASSLPVISADGSAIVFASAAADLVADQSTPASQSQLFVFNRASGATALVSHTPGSPAQGGNAGAAHFPAVAVSADGGFVAFTSSSSDLARGDLNGKQDLFLYANALPGRAFYTLTPCRVIDTRLGASGALASGVETIWPLAGSCGIPPTARALAVNVTVTQATAPGYLLVYPGDTGAPDSGTLEFDAGRTRANHAIVTLALDGSARLGLTPFIGASGTVHVLVDVNGYFE